MQNGILTPHPEESKILQDIFKEYLDGASLLKIAQNLTAKRTEFLPGRCDWNKNRVKRILEDARYLGTDTYPKLIDKDMLLKALEIKERIITKKKSKTRRFEVKHLPFCRMLLWSKYGNVAMIKGRKKFKSYGLAKSRCKRICQYQHTHY